MSYKDAYHPKTKTDLKKLDKPVPKELFDTHINNIINDPYRAGEALQGSLEGISTYHFRMNRVGYRIAFTIKEESKTVSL